MPDRCSRCKSPNVFMQLKSGRKTELLCWKCWIKDPVIRSDIRERKRRARRAREKVGKQ